MRLHQKHPIPPRTSSQPCIFAAISTSTPGARDLSPATPSPTRPAPAISVLAPSPRFHRYIPGRLHVCLLILCTGRGILRPDLPRQTTLQGNCHGARVLPVPHSPGLLPTLSWAHLRTTWASAPPDRQGRAGRVAHGPALPIDAASITHGMPPPRAVPIPHTHFLTPRT
jgi:hypothetical protein